MRENKFLLWCIGVGMIIFALILWWSIAVTNYVVNGGLAHDAGHFTKQFKEASK